MDADGDGKLTFEEFKVMFDNLEISKKDIKRKTSIRNMDGSETTKHGSEASFTLNSSREATHLFGGQSPEV